MITQELGPSSNWAFFSPSICEMSEESNRVPVERRGVLAFEARIAVCVLTTSWPHLKWKAVGVVVARRVARRVPVRVALERQLGARGVLVEHVGPVASGCSW
jgi:hypothetical protein